MGAPDPPLVQTRTAYMRYRGQGHEIAVPIAAGPIAEDGGAALRAAFEDSYRRLYGRIIPDLALEAMSWSLALAPEAPLTEPMATPATGGHPEPAGSRRRSDRAAATGRGVRG